MVPGRRSRDDSISSPALLHTRGTCYARRLSVRPAHAQRAGRVLGLRLSGYWGDRHDICTDAVTSRPPASGPTDRRGERITSTPPPGLLNFFEDENLAWRECR